MKTKEKLHRLLAGNKEAEFSYEIEELEKLEWDFGDVYEEVINAQGISREEAQKFERENYFVRIYINSDGSTTFELCQESHYGNESFSQGETGDDEKTINDVYKLEKLY